MIMSSAANLCFQAGAMGITIQKCDPNLLAQQWDIFGDQPSPDQVRLRAASVGLMSIGPLILYTFFFSAIHPGCLPLLPFRCGRQHLPEQSVCPRFPLAAC